MDSQLRKAQLLQLEIALEIKRICVKEGIPYFIVAGTLLGAVRNKGFIPWDDDMDVGMLREDYERFLKACHKNADSRFFLQTWDTDPLYGLPFAKLRLNGTRYVERSASRVKAHDGIYVDIFPFDNVPDDGELQKKQDRTTYFLKRLLLARNGYQVWEDGQLAKKLVYFILKAGAHLISRKSLQIRLLHKMQAYNTQNTEKIVTFGGSYGYAKESIRREWVAGTTELPFEHVSLSAPTGYTGYLNYFYGDYMTPPPEDKRENRHGIQLVSFGEYETVLPPLNNRNE